MSKKTAEIPQQIMPLADLKEHLSNPNSHSDLQIKEIRHLIKTHGYYAVTITIQKSSNTIIKGHGVREALIAEGYDRALVNVIDCDDTQALAILVADNKIATKSLIDDSALSKVIAELSGLNVPALDFGFNSDDLDELAQKIAGGSGYQATPEDDNVPEVKEAITKAGDLWLLGRHRVMCGDSTKAEDVARLCDGNKIDMVFTDPPYGMNLDAKFLNIHKNHNHGTFGKQHRNVIGDNKEYNPSHIFDFFGYCKEMFLWGADYYSKMLPEGGSWFVWDKVEGRFKDRIGNEFELCWSKQPHKRTIIHKEWVGHIGLETQDKNERYHPTQKPLEVIVPFLDQYSEPNNTILDLFLGSGSTLIAAHKLDRVCFGCEIDPHYTDVCIKRYADFVGSTDDIFVERSGQKIGYKELAR